jgi:alcohol dehydrogenase class IV
MSNLSYFSFPTGIIYGVGAIGELPGVLREMGVSRPIIITDAALTKTAAFTRVKEVLDGSGEEYHVFSDVHPNPLDTDVEAALEVYRHGRCDGIVGLGGGSPLDTAKALAVLASNGGDLARYDVQTSGGKYVTKPLPPIVGIPTTAGTGSEVGKCAVITSTRDHRKYMVCHPWMLPGRAILDAELTVSLPPALTAATGMDALTHCIESLTAPIFHPMCDGIALKGIEFVVANLEKAVKTPTDLEARGRMLLAASMGAVAFQKDLGAAHSISHALSAVCGVQHGLANAILLPPVMEFNLEVARDLYALIPPYFGISTVGVDPAESARTAVEQVRALNGRIGIPESLRAAGVSREKLDGAKLDEVIEKAYQDPCHRTNARPCTPEDLRDILDAALEGRSYSSRR